MTEAAETTAPGVALYRKRPIVIPGIPWDGGNGDAVLAFTANGDGRPRASLQNGSLAVWNDQEKTWLPVPVGHTVMRGALGELYPVSPDALRETFDLAEGGGRPEPRTMYHDSITALRRGIAEEAYRWEQRSWEILTQAGGRMAEAPLIASDARSASLMAGNFGYTLAAVLGVAYREFGPEVGERLANLADNVITNGDDNDLNADVAPAGAATEARL